MIFSCENVVMPSWNVLVTRPGVAVELSGNLNHHDQKLRDSQTVIIHTY
jgi:hypothetical protein